MINESNIKWIPVVDQKPPHNVTLLVTDGKNVITARILSVKRQCTELINEPGKVGWIKGIHGKFEMRDEWETDFAYPYREANYYESPYDDIEDDFYKYWSFLPEMPKVEDVR